MADERKEEQPVTAAHNVETCVVNHNIDDIWNAIRSLTFGFWTNVKSWEMDNKENKECEVGGGRNFTYKDNNKSSVIVTGLSNRTHTVEWETISSSPALPYSSRQDSIKLTKITFPVGQEFQTMVAWSTDFSNDVKATAVEDAKYKKHEAFQDLEKDPKGTPDSRKS